MARFVQAIIILAKIIYWFSGFVFIAGVVVFIFTTNHTGGLIMAGVGLGMVVLAKVLVFIAMLLFYRLDEAGQDIVDRDGRIRAPDLYW